MEQIQKRCKSSCGRVEANTQTEINHLENGQTIFKVKVTDGDFSHEHTVTVGAVDGNDALTSLSDDDLKQALQAHLDSVRQRGVDVIAARARVRDLAKELS